MKNTWIYLLFQSLLFVDFTEQKLDNYIEHYEEIDYNTVHVHQAHLRSKRSVRDKTLKLNFNAFKKDFKLVLKPDASLFSKYATSEQHDPLDTSHIYRGTLKGYPGSRIFGYFVNGHFTGTIKIPDDTTYHVEPTLRFRNKVANQPKSHSIIYKQEHINLDPHRLRREAERAVGSCGNEHSHEWEWMEKVKNSPYTTRFKRSEFEADASYHQNMYSAAMNRQKRALTGTFGPLPKANSTCFLFMQSDPKLFEEIKKSYGNDLLTKEDIIGTFATHVDAINNIYSNTRFENPESGVYYTGVQFKIQRTSVMTKASEKCGTTDASQFCQDNIDVSNFLNLNSLKNHNEFCLAYIFTYRDFVQGTLGLAWVGSETRSSGGICETFKEFTEGQKRVFKSLNTGIVTFVNYGDKVAPRVSQLTFAHEVGHNFGSPHDKGSECAPFGTSRADANDGNYIMYASATKGNQNHNDEFSPCSKINMTNVMYAVFNFLNGKKNCFKDSEEAFCGNSIREDTEECDCGYEGDCTDICCVPRQIADGSGCRLMAGKQCSPSQGTCCDPSTCAPYTDNRQCRPKTDCMGAQTCRNGDETCPASLTADSYTTLCGQNSKVCVDGFCTGSLCSKIDYTPQEGVTWVECFVKLTGDSAHDKEKQCLLGCRKNITGSECYSSGDDHTNNQDAGPFKNLLDEIKRLTGKQQVELAAGSPCNNFQGYCDVFKKCRTVDAEGPLSRLKNLLFSSETFTDIKEWITAHWWAVILIAIGLILFMGLFIKVCAVHTPSSNPKAPPAQHWGDTLRRRRSHPRRPQQQNPRYSEPLQHSPMGPPPPYSASASSSSNKPHPGHGRGQRGKGKGKNARV